MQANTAASIFETFHALSDEAWTRLVVASASTDDPRLPGFPEPEIQLRLNGQPASGSLPLGVRFYGLTKQRIEAALGPIHPGLRVLDFGAGWGRIFRLWQKDIAPENLFACDVSELMDSFWPDAFPGARFMRNAARPPLPDALKDLDVIYAHSVFSHLPPDLADAWITAFAERLKPNGLVILTTFHLETMAKWGELIGDAPYAVVHRTMHQDRAAIAARLARGEMVYYELAPNWGNALIPRDYMARWDRFDLLDYTEEGYPQAIATLQLKDA